MAAARSAVGFEIDCWGRQSFPGLTALAVARTAAVQVKEHSTVADIDLGAADTEAHTAAAAVAAGLDRMAEECMTVEDTAAVVVIDMLAEQGQQHGSLETEARLLAVAEPLQ